VKGVDFATLSNEGCLKTVTGFFTELNVRRSRSDIGLPADAASLLSFEEGAISSLSTPTTWRSSLTYKTNNPGKNASTRSSAPCLTVKLCFIARQHCRE
jgi:hypothetical protein